MTGYICGPRLYKYDGVTIEESGTGGPWPVRGNGDPYQRVPRRVALVLDNFCDLTDVEREAYRVSGGCRAIP